MLCFLTLFTAGGLAACDHGALNDLYRVSSSGGKAESVYLTRTADHKPVLAWTEKEKSGKLSFFYAVSEDRRCSFGRKIDIPVPDAVATHAEGMPKVAFKKDGTVMAAYERRAPTKDNKWAGEIFYVVSRDHGVSWSAPARIHSDRLSGRSHSYFDLCLLPHGQVGAAWLDIKLENDGDGGRSVRFARTENDNRFHGEILIDSSACECCRVDLFSDDNGKVCLAYRGLMKGDMGGGVRDMMIAVSSDGGRTFGPSSRISPDNWVIDGCPHSGPSLAANNRGLHAVWYTEGGGRGVYHAYADDSGGGFGPREQISAFAMHPQVCGAAGALATVWEESSDGSHAIATRIRFEMTDDGAIRDGYLSPVGANAYCPAVVKGNSRFLAAFLMDDEKGTGVYIAPM